jgi:hypothetical protein
VAELRGAANFRDRRPISPPAIKDCPFFLSAVPLKASHPATLGPLYPFLDLPELRYLGPCIRREHHGAFPASLWATSQLCSRARTARHAYEGSFR